MTQVSSTKKEKSFFTGAMGHNFKFNVKDNFKLMIVIFVLHFAAAPLLLITSLAEILTTGRHGGFDDGFITAAVIGTGLAAASGMICALTVFKYLYNKSAVDMRLSLPMTTSQRFISDFLSGLFIYIVPYIAAEIISWLLLLAGHILCDGKTFSYILPDQTDPRQEKTYSWVCNFFEQAAPFLWRGMLGGLMLMIMFYAVTVLVAGCCGNIFESAAYDILLNCLVPVSVYLGIYSVSSNVTGFLEDVYIQKIIPYCGPFGGAYGVILSLENLNAQLETPYHYSMYSPSLIEPLSFGIWFLLFTLCTLAVMGISYLIYRKRRAEDTGKPVVFGIFHHIIMTLGIFSLCYLMVVDGTQNFVPVIVITFIVYLVMHVIRNRGFGKIVSGLVIYGATIVFSIGSFLLIHDTKAFGAGDYVPDPESIASAQITYVGMFGKGARNEGLISELTDISALNTLTETHKQIIEYHNNNDESSDLYKCHMDDTFSIKYKLKSGRTVMRSYYYLGNTAVNTLSTLDTTREVTQSRAEHVKRSVTEYVIASLNEYEENSDYMGNKQKRTDLYAELTPQWIYSSGGKDYHDSCRKGYSELPEDFLQRLGDCLYNDILSESPEEYYTPSGRVWQFNIFNMNYIKLKESYTETMAYLSSCGFDTLPEPTEELVKKFITSPIDGIGISMSSQPLIEYMTGEDLPTATYYYLNGGYFRYKDTSITPYTFSAAYEYYDDLLTLIKHSYKEYKSDESCYTISVSGNSAVISEEYSDVAERVFIRMTADRASYMAEQDFFEAPFERDDNGNSFYGYSEYLSKFIEFYGKDKIVSALSCYYDSKTAEDTYKNLTEWAKVNTNFGDEYSEIYDALAAEGYKVVTEAYTVPLD
ncbi:MAG: hypothetical protein PUI48_05465 [Oscillospiraceae bacterium]|nr:hypothetical protein [Oscillospiraceae bacterium]MDY6208509.1 hypothetical protein [Oscillospiraceae bacterium]